MFRQILNKFNVDNFEELRGLLFSKLRKEETPDAYVNDILNGEDFSPRQLDFYNLLEKTRLGDLLPYEWFDNETGIYQTERSHGFIFNCGTVIGFKENLDDQLKGLFNIGLPDGTGMQTLLIASSEVEDKFAAYQAIHKTELQQKIAQSQGIITSIDKNRHIAGFCKISDYQDEDMLPINRSKAVLIHSSRYSPNTVKKLGKLEFNSQTRKLIALYIAGDIYLEYNAKRIISLIYLGQYNEAMLKITSHVNISHALATLTCSHSVADFRSKIAFLQLFFKNKSLILNNMSLIPYLCA